MPPLHRQRLLFRLLAVAGLALLLAGIWAVLLALGAPASLSPSDLSAWLQGEGPWGPVLLVLLMVLAVVVGPIPTLPVSAASGLAFGMLAGTLIAVVGAAIGAMVAFWTSRVLARDYFHRKLSGHPVFAADAPQASLFWGILFTRLVPVFSFALVSYAAGLTSVTALRFLVASVIGMIPMTFVFAGLGHTLDIHPVWSLAAAALVLLVMALLPWWWHRRGRSRPPADLDKSATQLLKPGSISDSQQEQTMKVNFNGITEGQPVPERFAFGVYSETDHMSFGPNRNPEVTWEDAPEGTRSFAVVMYDSDVPSVADDVNQEGKTVSKDIPRVDFFHWLLVDVPATTKCIPEGEDSDGVTPKGKQPGPGPVGLRGVNNFTQFLAGNPDMAGTYAGYDGPCPPWNDELVHRYHYEVYALDVESLGLEGEFDGEAVRKAMDGHILASDRVTATYTLNPALR